MSFFENALFCCPACLFKTTHSWPTFACNRGVNTSLGNLAGKTSCDFSSRKVAALSGDIRRALDLLSRSVEIAQSCRLEKVRIPHLQQAMEEMFSSSMMRAVKWVSNEPWPLLCIIPVGVVMWAEARRKLIYYTSCSIKGPGPPCRLQTKYQCRPMCWSLGQWFYCSIFSDTLHYIRRFFWRQFLLSFSAQVWRRQFSGGLMTVCRSCILLKVSACSD